MKKKPVLITALVAVIAVIIGFVFFHGGNVSSESAQKENAAEKTKNSEMVTLHIDNGAADANSDVAVNGLHVYDPNSEDLEDFADGAEVPKGTKVSIYVYNLASEVHLDIRHNGKVIADKDYGVLQSDDDVEFFDVTLEGNLTVKTSVINSKNKNDIATVHINDSSLAAVSMDGTAIENNRDIDFGNHSFTVRASEKDIKAQLKIGNGKAKAKTIKAGNEYTFKDQKVDGDVFLHFDYANKKDAKEAEEDAKNPNSKAGDKSVSEGGYSVTVVNYTGVELDVRYLDDNTNVHNVVSGNHYPQGLDIWARVINTSSDNLVLTATMGGQIVGSQTIKAKPANDDATYNGIGPVSLNGNLIITLKKAGGSTNTGTRTNGGKDHQGGKKTNPVTPGKTDQYALITINDGAKSANTDTAVNGLHVYNPDDPDLEDIKSGTKVPIGTKLRIYEYNLASEVRLTVDHNGKRIADKKLSILQSDADVQEIEVTVKGNLTVTTAVGKNTNIPTSKPIDTPEPTKKPETKTHRITVENQVPEVSVNLSYMDFTGEELKAIVVKNGDSVAEGTGIYVQISNPTSQKVKVSAFVSEKEADSAVINAAEGDEPGAGGLMGDDYAGIPLNGDMTVRVTAVKDEEQVFDTTDSAASYVKKQMIARNDTITFAYRGTFDKAASQAIMAKVFAVTDKGNEGDYLRYSNSGYQSSVKDNGDGTVQVTYTVHFFTTAEQEEETDQKLMEIETGLKVSEKSDFEKAKAVYQWICENVTYDTQATAADVLKNTAYQAVMKGTAQCEGYSNLFYRMMKDLGVDVRLIAGTYDGGGHAWNIVKIGNRWYNVDTTHGSQIQDQKQTITETENNTKYFLKGSDNFTENDPYDEYKNESFTGPYHTSVKDYVQNTDQSAIHLYISGSEFGTVYADDYIEYTDGTKLDQGEVNLVLMGMKSGVQVKVTSAGKTIYEGEADSSTGTDITVPVTDDVKVEFYVQQSYKVNIQNDTDATLNVRWLDGMTPVDIKDGDTFDEQKTVYTQVINTTDRKIRVTALKDGKEVQSITLNAKPSDDDGTYGGLNPITLNGNLNIRAEYVKEEETEYKVSLSGDQASKATVYVGNSTVKDGDRVKGKTKGIYIYNLDDDDDLANAEVTVTVDGNTVVEKRKVDYELDLDEIEITGNTVIDISTPEDQRQTYLLTIHDEAKAANTETAVNGLHVYDPDTKNQDELKDGTSIQKGQKLTIFEYNFATDVHLTVTHNGKTLFDDILKAPVSDSSVQFVEIHAVEGNVVVTATVADSGTPVPKLHINDDSAGFVYKGWNDIHEGASLETGEQNLTIYANNDPVHVVVKVGKQTTEEFDLEANKNQEISVNVTDDVSVEFTKKKAEEKKHTVTVHNEVDDAVVNLSYLDQSGEIPKAVRIQSGESLKDGTGIYVQVSNPTDRKIQVTATINGKEVGNTTVEAGTKDDPGAGGLTGDNMSGLTLDGDLIIHVTEAKPSYSVTFSGNAAEMLDLYDSTHDKSLKSGDSLESGTYTFYVYNQNYAEEETKITLKVNGEVIGTGSASSYNSADFKNVTVNGPVEFIAEKAEKGHDPTPAEDPKPVTHTVTVNNSVSDVAVNLSYLDQSSGELKTVKFNPSDAVAENTGIFVQVLNPTAQKVKVTASINGKEAGSAEVAGGTASNPGAGGLTGENYSGLLLNGDMTITVEPVTETYPVTVKGSELSWLIQMDGKDLTDDSSVTAGSHQFYIFGIDTCETHAAIKVNDQTVAEADIDIMGDHTFDNISVNGPVTIELTAK